MRGSHVKQRLQTGSSIMYELILNTKAQETNSKHSRHDLVEYFEEAINNRIWNWCEITDADIQDAMDRNNFQDYMRDEFQNVAWMCRRKPL